jgi:hypothetical protein
VGLTRDFASRYVLRPLVQPQHVIGRRNEAVTFIEAGGLFVDGVDDYETRCCRLSSRDGLAKRFAQQHCSEPFPGSGRSTASQAWSTVQTA